MVKQITRGKDIARNTYWSAVGMTAATMLAVQPVFADTIWDRFSTILKSFMDAIYQISGLHHGIYPTFDPRIFKGDLDIDFLRQSIDVMYRDFQLIGQFSGDAFQYPDNQTILAQQDLGIVICSLCSILFGFPDTLVVDVMIFKDTFPCQEIYKGGRLQLNLLLLCIV